MQRCPEVVISDVDTCSNFNDLRTQNESRKKLRPTEPGFVLGLGLRVNGRVRARVTVRVSVQSQVAPGIKSALCHVIF